MTKKNFRITLIDYLTISSERKLKCSLSFIIKYEKAKKLHGTNLRKVFLIPQNMSANTIRTMIPIWY